MKYLDLQGLESFFKIIKTKIPTKISQLENDSSFISCDKAYQTGQWTPKVYLDNEKLDVDYAVATYIKFDKICWLSFIANIIMKKDGEGNLLIKGLPFSAKKSTDTPFVFTSGSEVEISNMTNKLHYIIYPSKDEIKVKSHSGDKIYLHKEETVSLFASGIYLID